MEELIKNSLQYPQKSKEWLNERFNILTATDISSILECNPYLRKVELLQKKLELKNEESNIKMGWGNKYEPIAKQIYEQMYNVKIHDVGLIKHKDYNWLGASPDGIINNNKLIEIKCVWNRSITNKIPYYYWIQIQTQLEVCNMDECDFFQCKFIEFNNKTEYDISNSKKGVVFYEEKEYYWELIEYSLLTIKRDNTWFSKSLPLLQDFWQNVLYYRSKNEDNNIENKGLTNFLKDIELQKQNNKDIIITRSMKRKIISNINDNKRNKEYLQDWSKWICANEIKNAILNEHLIDWLNVYGSNNYQYTYNDNNINNFINQKYCDFHNAVFTNIKNRFESVTYKIPNVANQYQLYSIECVKETLKHIDNNVPIIFNPLFHDNKNQLICRPDMIIRKDYISKIFPNYIVTDMACYSNIDKMEYIVIDIKYVILQLKDNLEPYITANMNYYIAKLILQTQIVNNILCNKRNTSSIALVIGCKIKIKNMIKQCFEQPGVININNDKIQDKIDNALKWLKEMKMDGSKWKINPPSHHLLYPNMCNNVDSQWSQLKEEIALENKELTLISGIGIQERNKLHEIGIDKWDKLNNINMTQVNISSNKQKLIQNIIQNNMKYTENKIYPIKINLPEEWKCITNNLNVFIDFENHYYNNVNLNAIMNYNLGQYNINKNCNNNNGVYLIGYGYYHNEKWVFNSITGDNELDIFIKFNYFIENLKTEYGKINIIHWNYTEKSIYMNICKKYGINSSLLSSNYNWLDLLQLFKNVPITIQGVYNYNLKTIAKKMYEYKMISKIWENDINGFSSMIIADNNEIEKVKTYNEIDCFVLYEILFYLINNNFDLYILS